MAVKRRGPALPVTANSNTAANGICPRMDGRSGYTVYHLPITPINPSSTRASLVEQPIMSADDARSPAEQLAALKNLLAQLQSKVERLEATVAKESAQAAPTPSHTLRLVLMGPPGAGTSAVPPAVDRSGPFIFIFLRGSRKRCDPSRALEDGAVCDE